MIVKLLKERCTSVSEVKGIGWKPMALGVCIDTSVVFVALAAQAVLLKMI